MEKKQKKEYIQIIILSVLLILFGISIIFNSSISLGIKRLLYKADIKVSANDMVVHFIDVGQGDAIALKFPNEKVMMIDAGPKSGQNNLLEYIKDNVLSSNNQLIIDYVVLTHPDTDHSGGMSSLFLEFEVKNFFRPNIASVDEENWQDFVATSTLVEYNEVISNAKQEKDLKINVINKEYEFYIGDVLIQIFPPLKVYSTTNEMSPIIKVTYLNKSFLFTGDIQGESETDMLNAYSTTLDADVLKVAHHGSSNSTSIEFIQAVTPQYAIICVGENSYGHPHFNTISNLDNAGVEVLTTNGQNVRFVCGKELFGVLEEKVLHSYEFTDWWIIALVIELCLAGCLSIVIIKMIKSNNQDNKN